jgi:hypothetical protein
MATAREESIRMKLLQMMDADIQATSRIVSKRHETEPVDGRQYFVDRVMHAIKVEETQEQTIREYSALMKDMVDVLMDDTKVQGSIDKKEYIRDVITMGFGCWSASHAFCVADRLPSESLSGWNRLLEASVCPKMVDNVLSILDDDDDEPAA